MNGEGYLTLVETKLWRNPEARRTVVAQIIDYASHLSTWTYDDLRQAVLSCRNNDTVAFSDPLVDLLSDGDDDVDEQEFSDRMNRNLRLGRFVLLIVGDGIHEGVEKMADFLNQTPQLQFTLGLVEMGLYALDDKAQPADFFVQPRIVARTREVTRAVVESQNDGATERDPRLSTSHAAQSTGRATAAHGERFSRAVVRIEFAGGRQVRRVGARASPRTRPDDRVGGRRSTAEIQRRRDRP